MAFMLKLHMKSSNSLNCLLRSKHENFFASVPKACFYVWFFLTRDSNSSLAETSLMITREIPALGVISLALRGSGAFGKPPPSAEVKEEKKN